MIPARLLHAWACQSDLHMSKSTWHLAEGWFGITLLAPTVGLPASAGPGPAYPRILCRPSKSVTAGCQLHSNLPPFKSLALPRPSGRSAQPHHTPGKRVNIYYNFKSFSINAAISVVNPAGCYGRGLEFNSPPRQPFADLEYVQRHMNLYLWYMYLVYT